MFKHTYVANQLSQVPFRDCEYPAFVCHEHVYTVDVYPLSYHVNVFTKLASQQVNCNR